MNAIDERSIDLLSFTTRMTEYLTADDDDLAHYLPTLIWVIRDFALEINIDPNSRLKPEQLYLETALRILEGDSQEIAQKNEVRVFVFLQSL